MSFSTEQPTQITTTNATPGLMSIGPLNDNTCKQFFGMILAFASDGRMRSWVVVRSGKMVSGVAALEGTGVTVALEGTAGFLPTIALVLSGNVVSVQCTGLAATTIRWQAVAFVSEVAKP